MLVQQLYALAEKLEAKGTLPPSYHKNTKAKWALELDDEGNYQGLSAMGGDDRKGLDVTVPYFKRSGRTPPPYLLVDNFSYVLGARLSDDDGFSDERLESNFEQYVELVSELVAFAEAEGSIHAASLRALSSFLADTAEVERAVAQARTTDALSVRDLVVPLVGSVFVHELRVVQRFWADRQDAALDEKSKLVTECLVTGVEGAIAMTHPTEIRLGPNRVGLVSANGSAFESYGLRKSEIAPMRVRPARLYGEALVYLLGSPNHTFRAGAVTYVFWLKNGLTVPLEDIFASPPVDVRDRLEALFRGAAEPGTDIDTDTFYGAAVTANTSRLVVRDIVVRSVPEVLEALDGWFGRQRLLSAVDGGFINPMGIFPLAASAFYDANKMSPRVVPGLMRAALYGDPVPTELLVLALQRIAADRDNPFTRPRAVLVKVAVNDLIRLDNTRGELVGEELNMKDERPAYLCGRLFAVLEVIQQTALGYSVNTTIADKYYGTASSAPASVFGVLIKGAQPHLAKLRKNRGGAHTALQRDLEEVLSGLPEFPHTLGHFEQGLFALGYYHQRAARARAIEENKTSKND